MARGLNMGSAGIALLGLLAVKGFQHRDQIGKMLGDMSAGGGTSGSAGGLGGMLGELGDMLGGGGSNASSQSGGFNGNVLNEGLGGLLDRSGKTGRATPPTPGCSKAPIDPSSRPSLKQRWVTTSSSTCRSRRVCRGVSCYSA